MKQWNWRTAASLAGAALLVASAAQAKINKERGHIVSTDWRQMEMQIKHAPSGNVGTWSVTRDARVRFTDKKDEFPNPRLSDLRPPMYVYYMFEEGTNVIRDIEVVEVGYEPSAGGPGVSQDGTITNLDAEVGHIEVDLGYGPQTFRVDPAAQLRSFRRDQQVTLLIETRGNGEEVVTLVRPRSGQKPEAPVTRSARITNLDTGVDHIEVDLGAGPQTFRVEPTGQLNSLRKGQRVEVRIETRADGTKVVTQVRPVR
jgi:Cu/Ag efflux protein CusF